MHDSVLFRVSSRQVSYLIIYKGLLYIHIYIYSTLQVYQRSYSGPTYSSQNVQQIWESTLSKSDIVVLVGRESGHLKIFFYISRGEYVKHFMIDAYL